ncbi:BTB/POZ and MATH domain-containing protein 2-like [Triticum dicoccoides]|uniref:BTB/POZ and MATH domain-containing protein 2-like n=1 Tax=Triticum dicoccoides TaxID=85692 RepID=UPI000E7A4C99|nr:BTB/POZ and MATH domain-containing protein 2-like [Triticum dicoccoides]
MSSTGESIFTGGKLLDDDATPIINAGATSGYHYLVVEGHSRCRGSICSRIFIIGGQHWFIYYYPHADGGLITLQLCLLEGSVDPVKAQFEFTFVEEKDKKELARSRIHGEIFEFRGRYDHHKKVLKREVSEKYVKDDCFIIRCDVVVVGEPPSMQENFTELLLSGLGTDIVFGVGGETFAAHRCVLAARSAVFRALLFSPMKEGTPSTTSVVQIDDMDAAVFKAMLGFMYGDSLPDENEGVLMQHLFVAADRYDLPLLRTRCEEMLCKHIGVSTAATILVLADQHGCDKLKTACYGFLGCPANLKAVVQTEGFEHLQRSCPHLMKDIILRMLP